MHWGEGGKMATQGRTSAALMTCACLRSLKPEQFTMVLICCYCLRHWSLHVRCEICPKS